MKTIAGIFAMAVAAMLTPAAYAGESGSRILIVYFSLGGHTRSVAEMIRQKTGGDIFVVETRKPYSAQQTILYEEVKRELDSGQLPALGANPPDMSGYDVILVGGPVWFYTVSTPLMSFLGQADFAGKKVAAFVTHGGGMGDYYRHFRDMARNAVIVDGIDFPNRSNQGEISGRLDAWLAGLR